MPLHVRSVATNIAVICFYSLSIVGWLSNLSPFTCTKRALAGALLTYIVASLAVKAINAILINAMVTKQMNQQKENSSGDKN